MNNWQKLINDATEKRALNWNNALENQDSYYFKAGSKLPNELLLKALSCLDYYSDWNNHGSKGFAEARKTLDEIRQALEKETL